MFDNAFKRRTQSIASTGCSRRIRFPPLRRSHRMKACILLPVYNDWKCLPRLLSEIEKALSTIDASATVVILNDGGDPAYNSKDFLDQAYSRIVDFQMIELVRNVGNQNALSIGLS